MIYIQGDLHGSVGKVRACLTQIPSPTVDDTIIVCGDAGLEYGDHIMGSVKKEMKKFPGRWIIMRGNHDTRYWRDHIDQKMMNIPADGWAVIEENEQCYLVQKKYPNIWYVRDDGGIYNIEGYNFLFIPGAYSVDKYYRLNNNLPYENDEQLTCAEWTKLYKDTLMNMTNIDYVIAHTAPYYLEENLKYLFLPGLSQAEIDKDSEKWIEQIMENALLGQPNFKHFFFGHFHDDKQFDDKHTMVYNVVRRLGDYNG